MIKNGTLAYYSGKKLLALMRVKIKPIKLLGKVHKMWVKCLKSYSLEGKSLI